MRKWVWRNRWRIAVSFFILGLLLPFAIVPYVAHTMVQEMMPQMVEHHHKIRSMLPKILADLKTVSERPPFPKWTRERNAEPYLSRFVSWQGRGFEPLESPSHQALRALFLKYPGAMTEASQFHALADDPEIEKVDTAWLENITAFDHWRLTSHQTIHSELERARNLSGIERLGVTAALPIPDFKELRHFAFLHLVKKHKQQKILEGFKIYRKTAQLINSTGTLVGNMVAVVLLKNEHQIAVWSQTSRWKVVAERQIMAYKRVSWVWAGLVRDTWFKDFPHELERYLKPQMGICGGVGEMAMGMSAFNDFLEPQFIFEDDFSEPLQRTREFQQRAQEICGQQEWLPFTVRAPASANPLFTTGPQGEIASFINPARVPYIRRVVAVTLMNISTPSYLRLYEEETR